MKKTKKQFAVKVWFELGGTHFAVVSAFTEKEASEIAIREGEKKYNIPRYNSNISYLKIKQLPSCVLRSVFGNIKLEVNPNPHYDNEIIINNTRINLPGEFNYWDIDSITIHNAGLPTIATIKTKNHTFVVQNNPTGSGTWFEIIK